MIEKMDLAKAFAEIALDQKRNSLDAAELVWPLIDAYQKRQLIQGRGLYADEIALFNELKEKLGVSETPERGPEDIMTTVSLLDAHTGRLLKREKK